MRSDLAARRARRSGYNGAQDNARAASPDQVSVVWGAGTVSSAAPQSAGVRGTYSLDIIRYPADINLREALNLRRKGQLGLPSLSGSTVYSTAVAEYSERTRVLALTGEQLAMRDDELAQWLIEAERQMTRGTDNHPLFETSIEDTVCSIGRLPNGQVTMTEVPRAHVETLRDRIERLSPGDENEIEITIETPVRSVARYFLTAMPEGESAQLPGKAQEITAFLLIGRGGFSWGLWSPEYGLFSEYSFLAPQEMAAEFAAEDRQRENDATEKRDSKGIERYITRAFDQLFAQLTPERLEQLQATSYAQVVWASEIGLAEHIQPIASEYQERSGVEAFQIPVPSDEAVAAGLLFGTFAFGDTAPAGAQIVPQVDLTRDLLALADSENVERQRLQEQQIRRQRNRAVLTLLAAPVVATAVIVALAASLVREQIGLTVREARADSRTEELRPALERRLSYEANLKWYQEFITQVSALRRQQPVSIGLLYELNNTYPVAADPSFYVSEMKLAPTGAVELRGLSRNKDAIAAFLKSLEFAGGTGSGTRLFSNLAYEVQEGTSQPVPSRAGLPAMSGTAAAPPGVVAWSLRGTYLPAEAFAPPDPNKKPPTPPPAAQPPAQP